MNAPHIMRALAIAIVVAGVVDPTFSVSRSSRPDVSLIVVDSTADAELAERVERELRKDFSVLRAPFSAAAATVVVGDRVPARRSAMAAPFFAVTPEHNGPTLDIDAVESPRRAKLDSRAHIVAAVRARNSRGRQLHVSLLSDGLVLDRSSVTPAADDEQLLVPLTFVPSRTGAAHLRIEASFDAEAAGAAAAARADAVVDVDDSKWTVFFHDLRPSWMSTFVRRTLEEDARFVVTSRVQTTRNVTRDQGAPPAIADVAALELFDAIVIGAPEALTARDIEGLEQFLRRRGGGVALLFDEGSNSVERLTGVRRFEHTASNQIVRIRTAVSDSLSLRASELAWVNALPAGATSVAEVIQTSASPVPSRAAVWVTALGAGRVLVNGALDSWRFREDSASKFSEFWRAAIADLADASPQRISVDIPHPIVAPGEVTHVSVMLREGALAPRVAGRSFTSAVTARLEGAGDRLTTQLYPTGNIGELAGEIVAPDSAGTYRLVVSADANEASATLMVLPGVVRAAPADTALLATFVRASGGTLHPASGLSDLHADLVKALEPPLRRELVHPMRSPLWILPLALFLGSEWWWRRRRGLS